MRRSIIIAALLISKTVFAASPIEAAFEYSAKVNNINSDIIRAICYVESKHNPKAYNHSDGGSPSYGLCQVKLESALWMKKMFKLRTPATAESLMNPQVNALYAGKLIHFYLRQYHGDLNAAVRAYNHGNFDGKRNTNYHAKVEKALKEFSQINQ